MNAEDGGFVVGFALGMLVTAIIGVKGCGWDDNETRIRAIEAGVAEWRVNPETGETRLEFIKPGHSKEQEAK